MARLPKSHIEPSAATRQRRPRSEKPGTKGASSGVDNGCRQEPGYDLWAERLANAFPKWRDEGDDKAGHAVPRTLALLHRT